ncbi:MAG TPA: hypothetical protein PLT67_09780 [Kiritimatiellia bacterium]|nr:hypothetical protein [Kiritimatiellia bacterium]
MLKKISIAGSRYRGELLFMAANYTTPLVAFYASSIAAFFITPEEMGSVQAALLIIPYFSMLHLGVFHGLNRNLAFYFGQGNREKGLMMVNASAFIARTTAWIGALAGLGLVACALLKQNSNMITVAAGVAAALALYCTPYITHISTTNRSGQHFHAYGKIVFISNILRLVYSSLPVIAGWIGYVAALALQPLITVGLLKAKEPYPAEKRFQWADLGELIKVGFPIMVVGYFTNLLMVADQTFIALYMPKERLGHYVLAKLIMQAMIIIPATLSILISPKVASCYGETGSARSLRKYFWAFFWLHVAFIVPVCALAYVAVGPLVHWLLPRYIPGIAAAKITILTCLTFVAKGAFVITATMRKNTAMIILHGAGLAAMWLIGILMFEFGQPSLEHVAWLRFWMSAVVSAGLLGYGLYMTREGAVC